MGTMELPVMSICIVLSASSGSPFAPMARAAPFSKSMVNTPYWGALRLQEISAASSTPSNTGVNFVRNTELRPLYVFFISTSKCFI